MLLRNERVDTQRSTVEQAKAAYEAYEASVKIAQDNYGEYNGICTIFWYITYG